MRGHPGQAMAGGGIGGLKEKRGEVVDRKESLADRRYQQERQEDQERWEHYILTGEHILHTEVMKWLENIAAGEEPTETNQNASRYAQE